MSSGGPLPIRASWIEIGRRGNLPVQDRWGSKMAAKRPLAADNDHRVIRFRPRSSAEASRPKPPVRAGPADGTPTDDLSRYVLSREPDDYRHRMTMNVAAAAFTILLTAFGIWLAISISDLRKTQDCILIGRRDCGKIPARIRPRIRARAPPPTTIETPPSLRYTDL